MAAQDAALLGALRELPVAAGDAIFVPAGTPHAIGEGILLVELQEPTDLSVMLEWEPFGLSDDDAHLGLGWDAALEALDTSAWGDERLAGVTGGGAGRSLLPAAADAFFRAERVRGGDELDQGFSILVGIAGSGELGDEPFGRGDAVLVPYGAGTLALTGDAEAIRCRPPAP
jgi:mannose-6-phosphate isomerase